MIFDFFHQQRLNASQQALFDKVIRTEQLSDSRLFTAIALLLSLFFLFSDYQFLRDEFEHVATIRISIVICCLFVFGLLTYLSTKVAFNLIAVGVVSYNIVIVYLGVLAAEKGLYIYQQGTVLIIIYCCTLFQAPLRHTAIITFTCCLTYIIGILMFSKTDTIVVINNVFIFITAAIFGLMAVMQREGHLIQFFQQSQVLKKKNKEVHEQALTDALTQLPNRFSLMSVLESYQGKVPSNMLIMMLDVDDFKKLNDELGHTVGDIALQRVSSILNKHVTKEQGYIARYGGEEFIVFLEDVSRASAQEFADSLVSAVRDMPSDGLPPITVSLGAYVTKGQEQSISVCIEVADQELLRAKKSGKNQAMFAGF